MDPVTIGLLGASVAPSIIGMFQGNKGDEYIDKAVQEMISVSIPDPERQKIALERYRSAGELAPELESAIKADPSAFEGIVKNQKYAGAQNKALDQLQSLGEQGGMSLSDKAELQQQLIANANKDKANRGAITDDMARRGQLGGGMAMQAQLAGAQDAGDRDAMARLQTAGSARDRALQAISQGGALAGQMGAEDFSQKSAAAQARDRINQFNTENAQNVMQRNIGSRNAAQSQNLQQRQNLMNSNVDIGNKEQQYNKELLQQDYNNRLGRSKGIADAYGSKAQQENMNSAQNRQAMGAVGSGIAQVGGAVQNKSNWDDWMSSTKKPKKLAGESWQDFSTTA